MAFGFNALSPKKRSNAKEKITPRRRYFSDSQAGVPHEETNRSSEKQAPLARDTRRERENEQRKVSPDLEKLTSFTTASNFFTADDSILGGHEGRDSSTLRYRGPKTKESHTVIDEAGSVCEHDTESNVGNETGLDVEQETGPDVEQETGPNVKQETGPDVDHNAVSTAEEENRPTFTENTVAGGSTHIIVTESGFIVPTDASIEFAGRSTKIVTKRPTSVFYERDLPGNAKRASLVVDKEATTSDVKKNVSFGMGNATSGDGSHAESGTSVLGARFLQGEVDSKSVANAIGRAAADLVLHVIPKSEEYPFNWLHHDPPFNKQRNLVFSIIAVVVNILYFTDWVVGPVCCICWFYTMLDPYLVESWPKQEKYWLLISKSVARCSEIVADYYSSLLCAAIAGYVLFLLSGLGFSSASSVFDMLIVPGTVAICRFAFMTAISILWQNSLDESNGDHRGQQNTLILLTGAFVIYVFLTRRWRAHERIILTRSPLVDVDVRLPVKWSFFIFANMIILAGLASIGMNLANASSGSSISYFSFRENSSYSALMTEVTARVNASSSALISENPARLNASFSNAISDVFTRKNSSFTDLISEVTSRANASSSELISEFTARVNASLSDLISELTARANVSSSGSLLDIAGRVNASLSYPISKDSIPIQSDYFYPPTLVACFFALLMIFWFLFAYPQSKVLVQ